MMGLFGKKKKVMTEEEIKDWASREDEIKKTVVAYADYREILISGYEVGNDTDKFMSVCIQIMQIEESKKQTGLLEEILKELKK